jgi:hypothetical protein
MLNATFFFKNEAAAAKGFFVYSPEVSMNGKKRKGREKRPALRKCALN